MSRQVQLINPTLYKEVCDKKEVLLGDTRFCLHKRSLLERALDEMGNVESWWMEHPQLFSRMCSIQEPDEREKELRNLSEQGIQQVRAAWENLQNFSFKKEVPLDAVIETGYLVDPNNIPCEESQSSFRTKGAYNGLSVAGANAESIHRDLQKTLSVINYGPLNDVEKGIYLHLNMARIQPFQDGNKRTARLLQRKLFYDSQFPQFPLLAGEKSYYVDLMNESLEAQISLDHKLLDIFKSHGVEGACSKAYAKEVHDAFCYSLQGNDLLKYRQFFDFMATKVTSAQDLCIRGYD